MSGKPKESFAELLSRPDEVSVTVQQAVREALVEHGKAGQPVTTWREGKVVWVNVDADGHYAEEV